MKTIHVIIADSFDIIRHGVKSILSGSDKFSLAASVKNGKELMETYKKNPESVCIVSSNVPDFNIHDVMKSLRKINPEASVIVLTNSTEVVHLNQSLKAGVKGYLTRNTSAQELTDAVIAVSRGKQVFGKSVSQLMIGKYADLAKKSTAQNRKLITKREREILKLIVEGYTSSEIAKLLYISTRTVETHRSNLMNKLELKNTAALVRFALEEADLT